MADLNDESGESELALETTGRLMDFEHTDGKLRVHYSDRLVTLLREVRQLGALGFVIPAKSQRTAATAKQLPVAMITAATKHSAVAMIIATAKHSAVVIVAAAAK